MTTTQRKIDALAEWDGFKNATEGISRTTIRNAIENLIAGRRRGWVAGNYSKPVLDGLPRGKGHGSRIARLDELSTAQVDAERYIANGLAQMRAGAEMVRAGINAANKITAPVTNGDQFWCEGSDVQGPHWADLPVTVREPPTCKGCANRKRYVATKNSKRVDQLAEAA